MSDSVRFTYRPPEWLFKQISKEAERKRISINSELNNILSEYYEKRNRQNDSK